MLWDPRDLGSCRAVLPSDPVDLGSFFLSRHVSDAHAVGISVWISGDKASRNSKLKQSLFISHTLHLAAPTVLEKGIESSEPCRVHSLRKVSQDGADVKDCSRSNILLTSSEIFCDGYFLKRKNIEMKEKC